MPEKKGTWDNSGLNDVYWKPVAKIGEIGRTRTLSTDSTGSVPTSPDSTSSGRRFSITGMLFGSPGINRQASLDTPNPPDLTQTQQRRPTMTESVERMIKEHRKMLDDIP